MAATGLKDPTYPQALAGADTKKRLHLVAGTYQEEARKTGVPPPHEVIWGY
ncbi:MAG: hypothetical protein LBT14_09480 [Treponema sp.]|nr:hypothetical protein [Treponema sp.]